MHNSLLRFSLAEKMNENFTVLLHSESNEKIQSFDPNQLKYRNNGQGNFHFVNLPWCLLCSKIKYLFIASASICRLDFLFQVKYRYLSDVRSFIFLEEASFGTKSIQERSAMAGSSSSSNSDTLSKAVSANITRILEDLLKNYDKTERPSYQDGKISKQSWNSL